jgi:uncharacterized membrane protein YGL010W
MVDTHYDALIQDYQRSHREPWRLALRAICVPLFAWSIFGMFHHGSRRQRSGRFLYVAYLILYAYLGVPWDVWAATALVYGTTLAHATFCDLPLRTFAAAHGVAWACQILEHLCPEADQPTFLTRLGRSVVTGPVAVVAEMLEVLRRR